MIQNLKIAVLKKDQKIWFVRSDGGRYAELFRKGGVIAIKHLEDIYEDELPAAVPNEETIRAKLLRNDKYSEFRSDGDGKDTKVLKHNGSIVLRQIVKFTEQIEQGDLVFTKNEVGDYTFGICCEDDAYISNETIENDRPENADKTEKDKIKLYYKLRKKVNWGPTIPGRDIPSAVRKATRGQQTVTLLSEHKDKLYHLIYPFFTYGDSLYVSNKIRAQGAINALAVGKLFENLSLAEPLLEALLNNEEFDLEAILDLVDLKSDGSDLNTTCAAEFSSPGDVWANIPLSDSISNLPKILAAALVYLLLTGQVSAEEIQSIDANNIKVSNAASIPDSMFNEKYQIADVAPSLKNFKDNVSKNKTNLKKIKEKRAVTTVKERLEVEVVEINTKKLENFDFGINVVEVGISH